MPYNEHLADRITALLDARHVAYTTKKMFGGVCFMVDDKMLCGVLKNELMVRLDPAEEPEALSRPAATRMDESGRSMKGFIMVEEDGYDMDRDLELWLSRCLAYNPLAKSSKKK